jgi:hypothetical protein
MRTKSSNRAQGHTGEKTIWSGFADDAVQCDDCCYACDAALCRFWICTNYTHAAAGSADTRRRTHVHSSHSCCFFEAKRCCSRATAACTVDRYRGSRTTTACTVDRENAGCCSWNGSTSGRSRRVADSCAVASCGIWAKEHAASFSHQQPEPIRTVDARICVKRAILRCLTESATGTGKRSNGHGLPS